MREVKFRGKRYNGMWVYGDLCMPANRFASIRENKYSYNGVSHEEYEVIGETIGQFTGLKDKNGNEIYEGDIVKTPLLDPIFGDIIKDAFCNAEIRFNKGSFVLSYYKREHNIYISDLHDKIEVIGNIFDNKELLE